jgi:L-2-amino-thiazoline-4-carboxylic acid hydrolase
MKGNLRKGLFFAISYVTLKWAAIALFGTYLYEKGLWSNWFLVIIPVIGLTVILVRKKRKSEMTFTKYFQKAIEKHFALESAALIKEVDERFKVLSVDTRFASKSSNPLDKRLDFAAYFLALIQILENRNLSYNEIKSICLEVTYDYVSPKNSLQKWLKRLPANFIGLRITKPLLGLLHNKVVNKGNEAGFRAEIITDKTQTYNFGYGFDIFECGICKLFQKHNAGKYAAILCEVDKVTSNLAGLELIRNSTIAYGAKKCDFRFRKISKPVINSNKGNTVGS